MFWYFESSAFQRPYSKVWTAFEENWRFYNARKLCDFALKSGIRIARPNCLVTWPDDVVLWTRYEIVIWRRVRKYEEEGVLRRWRPEQTTLYEFEQHSWHKNASVSCRSSCEGQMGEICPKTSPWFWATVKYSSLCSSHFEEIRKLWLAELISSQLFYYGEQFQRGIPLFL